MEAPKQPTSAAPERKSPSIRARLVLLVLTAILPLVVLLALHSWQDLKRARTAQLERTTVRARLIAARLDDRLDSIDALLVGISRMVTIAPDASAHNEAALRAVAADLPAGFCRNLVVHAPDGSVLGSATGQARANVSGRKYFREALERHGLIVGDAALVPAEGVWTLTLARAVTGANGQTVAVVSAAIALDSLRPLLNLEGLPDGVLISLLDEHRMILARSAEPEKWVGKPSGENVVIDRLLASPEGSVEMTAPDGQKKLAGFSTCARAPWHVYVRVPTAVVLAPGWQDFRDTLGLSLLTLTLTLALAWLVAHRITRPIRQLTADVAAIGAGTFQRPTPVKSEGEVGLLARAFGEMLGTLAQRDEALRLSEARYRRLIDHAPEAIVVFDAESGHFVDHNPAAEALFKMSTAELREASPVTLSPPFQADGQPSGDRAREFIQRAVNGETPVFEWTHRDRTGRDIACEIRLLRLADEKRMLIRGSITDIEERQLVQRQLSHERAVLERLAQDAPLPEVLEALVRGHEKLFPGTIGSVLLLDAAGKHLGRGIGPSLPETYTEAIDGEPIGPSAGSCGVAAFTGEQVIVDDIAADPRWADYRELALSHGLRACWSTPIRSGTGQVRGTFALYYREPRAPQARELTAIASSARLASIAIERTLAKTAQAELERKLLETQKLESLGVLAGGIAHDFNNILTGILGNASLAAVELPAGSPVQERLDQVHQAAMRAADLCKQMLAYSGKGRFVVQKIDLGSLVEETTPLLEISISKKAVLRFDLMRGLPPVEADATQVRQVIMNLVINAYEAIGERSGVIMVSTSLARVDRAYLGGTLLAPELPEGDYVCLEITDTGCGMSPETQMKIFDPFFTTKFTGRGLGLAAVLGIMRGHKGALKVYSELGRGTTFRLLFPRASGVAEALALSAPARPAWRGQGRVLVADDEETVRATTGAMLRALGFEPRLVADGQQAVEAFCMAPDDFALVLLDLTMPRPTTPSRKASQPARSSSSSRRAVRKSSVPSSPPRPSSPMHCATESFRSVKPSSSPTPSARCCSNGPATGRRSSSSSPPSTPQRI